MLLFHTVAAFRVPVSRIGSASLAGRHVVVPLLHPTLALGGCCPVVSRALKSSPSMVADSMRAEADTEESADTSERILVTPERPPRHLSIKYIVLLLLVLQNSATTLVVRHTRTPRPGAGPLYLGAMAVLVSELLKLPTCLMLIARDEGSFGGMICEVRRGVFQRWKDTLRMGVPALCYGLQNALFFVALSNLSASSYQLWSQSKTLFTALFFVTLLGKVLKPIQWVALGLLTIGVGLVQLQEASGASAVVGGVPWVGVAAVLCSSLLSGFANIYFEKVLKQADCEVARPQGPLAREAAAARRDPAVGRRKARCRGGRHPVG